MFKDAFASFRALIFCRLFLAALRFFFTAFLHAARNSESSCYGGENADDNLYQRFPCFSFHHDFPFFLVVKYLCFLLRAVLEIFVSVFRRISQKERSPPKGALASPCFRRRQCRCLR